jgi:hypothetical protein
MKRDPARCVENDIAANEEPLSSADLAAIRARCSEEVERGIPQLVEASPPVAPKTRRLGQELYAGLLGQSFGFLHLHERTGAAKMLELARQYLEAALEALDASGVPRPEEWISFHASGGASAVAAVVHDRLGDVGECERHLENYRRVALRAADPAFPTEDLLWGRGGFVFGAAYLRSHLGEERFPDELVVGPLEQMIATGRRLARAHAAELTPGPHGRPPLLYMNFVPFMMECFARSLIGSRSRPARTLAALAGRAVIWVAERRERLSHRYDIGLVHGLAGNLYLMLHFPELVERLGASAEVRASLDCLADCIDAERGMLEVLPSRHSAPNVFTDKVHWCNGTTGAVFLFARAYEVFGEAKYLDVARRAAEHVWRYGLLRKGNGLCHGVAGNAYAFLTLYRTASEKRQLDRALHFARFSWSDRVTRAQQASDRPWSLYEGRMGTLCFYRDCLDPQRSRFPAFEV